MTVQVHLNLRRTSLKIFSNPLPPINVAQVQANLNSTYLFQKSFQTVLSNTT